MAIALYDFEQARDLLARAEQQDGFALAVVLGPRLGGKTKLLREFLKRGRPELVLDVDLRRVTGAFELIKLMVTRARPGEFDALTREVHQLLDANVSFERTKIVNSQLTFRNPLTPERLELAVALSLSEDLARLQRKLIIAFDHTYACDRELASLVHQIVDAMRSSDRGLVIFEHVVRDPRLAMLEDGRGQTVLDPELFAEPQYAIHLPRFQSCDVQRFAEHLGVSLDPSQVPLIADGAGGVPGLVELMLMGIDGANGGHA